MLRERAKRQGAKRSPHWPTVRKAHLESQPTCQACGGTEDLEVHHIHPFHLSPAMELAPGNLITLCEKRGHDCHFTWGHFHDWKLYNPIVRQDAARYLEESLRAREDLR